MPIRHCQKCGLKVLIDEAQAGINPFLCQRCSAAIASGDTSAVESVLNTTDTGDSNEPKARPTVKLICPACHSSFKGRLPSRAAHAECPVCKAPLILQPDGALSVDGAAETKRAPDTRELLKYAADPKVAQQAHAAGSEMQTAGAPASTDPLDAALDSALGTAFDEPPARPAPPPPAEPPLVRPPTPPPPVVPQVPRRPESRPPAAETPPPRSVPRPAPTRRTPVTPPRALSTPEGTGLGRCIAAVLLLVAPPIASYVLYNQKDPSIRELLQKIGARMAPVFRNMPEPPPTKPVPPPPRTTDVRPTPPVTAPPPVVTPPKETLPTKEALATQLVRLWEEIRRGERTIKTMEVGATEAQKRDLETKKKELKEKKLEYDRQKALYEKNYGPFNPDNP